MKTVILSIPVLISVLFTNRLQAQVPVLNSLPSASATIFLDFDGHTVTGTSWNFNGPIFCNPSGLTAAQITAIFNRVAEDYRPFDVNITTDSTKFLAAPFDKRMRVIETTSWEWYGQAGGVAFISSFTWGDDSPCFVFTNLLGFSPKNIAEATSHEAGHTLSLQHQSVYDASCIKTNEYNSGSGSGEIGWAPIMGTGYYQNMTLWNSGKSSVHCDTIQNDLTIITSNGFSYRTDEHPDTFNSSTNITLVNNQFALDGIITESTDVDMIRFNLPANGRLQLNALPYSVGANNAGSNLDLQVTLYDGLQNQLNIYNPGNSLNLVIDSNLMAGSYYLKIEGRGNAFAPNYASLGSYSLTANFTSSTLPLHKLELTGKIMADQHLLNWVVEADESITSQILEYSTDGRHFTSLKEMLTGDRNYSYQPKTSNSLQYRLKVSFDNGKQHYSNIVFLKNQDLITGPVLSGNMVQTNLVVNSPGIFDYAVFETSGRQLSRGTVTIGINNINTGSMKNGLYMIRFTDGHHQFTEKFIRK